MTKLIRLVACIGALVLVLAACGSSSKKSDTKPADSSTSSTTKAKPKFTATAEPTTGLTEGQTVTVKVAGFTAGKTLGINECAQAGTAEVGGADCALDAIKTLTVAADGTGEGTTTVSKGPIGQNAHMCGTPDVRCFLSVGELIEGDAERSEDIDLTFAP
ncbi:MAG: hypothetical protein JJE46_13545 [Acidimicrobiia bacterium]|nr:hypothetical protein [Acidimicrobiia bacterium]